MKKAILTLRLISLIGLLVGVGFILVAPQTVALHITADNVVDSSGSRFMLLLEPLLLIIVNEVSIFSIKRYRRNFSLTEAPMILVKEWYYISAAITLLITFIFVMYQQVTWH